MTHIFAFRSRVRHPKHVWVGEQERESSFESGWKDMAHLEISARADLYGHVIHN